MREQVLGQHPSLDDKLVPRGLKGHSNYKIVFQLPQERNSYDNLEQLYDGNRKPDVP